jgi:predicted nucleotidyltransferase component of viral defense system
MITLEILEQLARQYQTPVFPNIVREYFQHEFLADLYKLPEAGNLLFKGGTALRLVYGSPRFSEDLDFSLFGIRSNQIKSYIEELFVKVLAEIERVGIEVELGSKSGATTGGYFGVASFSIYEFQPVNVEINISSRNGREIKPEIDSVAGDFAPAYTIIHLPQVELVEEKIFGALLERGKPRDFYDLYFMMRKGMLSVDQKKRLTGIKERITSDASRIDFRGELGAFLPADQQAIIRDFIRALEAEISRQIG